MPERTCSISDCNKPVRSTNAQWCDMHYMRWYRHGDPLANPPRRKPPEPRFWAKVNKTETCWVWTAGKAGEGYGLFFRHQGEPTYAHRFAYELLIGPIPDGYAIDHLCRVRLCVNPEHLEAVTPRENVLRAVAATRKTHCSKGHPYGAAVGGRRRCRICQREYLREWKRRKAQ